MPTFSKGLQAIFALHRRIASTLQTLHLLWQPQWKQDPFKLYLLSDKLSGAEMDAYLRTRHALYSEMHDNNGILFILPIQTTDQWTERLYQALQALDQFSQAQTATMRAMPSFYCRELPQQRYPLQEAFYKEKTANLLAAGSRRYSRTIYSTLSTRHSAFGTRRNHYPGNRSPLAKPAAAASMKR